MTPYLIHKTWVDLDHVIGIGSVVHIPSISCGDGWLCAFTVDVTCMFLNVPMRIEVADGGRDYTQKDQLALYKLAKERLDAFIEAWKTNKK